MKAVDPRAGVERDRGRAGLRLKVTPLWVPETTQNSHHAFMIGELIE